LIQHDVLWLEIPVDDARGMRGFERPANLSNDVRSFGGFELFLSFEDVM
jgi:hypothetical protein